MKNLDDLRAILFDEIEHVKNNPNADSLARANAVNSLAQSLIETAKVEVNLLVKTESSDNCAFINPNPPDNQPKLQSISGREKIGRKW